MGDTQWVRTGPERYPERPPICPPAEGKIYFKKHIRSGKVEIYCPMLLSVPASRVPGTSAISAGTSMICNRVPYIYKP